MTISVERAGALDALVAGRWAAGLIVVGGGHEVGADVDTEGRYADLSSGTRETFEVAKVWRTAGRSAGAAA